MVTKEILYKNFRSLFQIDPPPIVEAHIAQLLNQNYSYEDINNALWFVFVKLKLQTDVKVYGIFYVKQHIEEAILYFKAQKMRQEENIAKLKSSSETPRERIKIKRQERRTIEREYDWDDLE